LIARLPLLDFRPELRIGQHQLGRAFLHLRFPLRDLILQLALESMKASGAF
jgi:hypothetical protein